MPDYEDAYRRRLAEARRRYVGDLQPAVVRALYLELADLIDAILRDMGQGAITSGRAEGLLASVLEHLEAWEARTAATVSDATLEAARQAAQGHADALAAAVEVAGVQANATFTDIPRRAIERMFLRRGLTGARTFRTLIRRHAEDLAGDLDRLITSHVARGVSARRGAEEIAKLIAGDDANLLAALEALEVDPMTRRVQRLLQADAIPEADLRRARTLLQDAYRIAVHETNTAYHESNRASMERSPVVGLVRWQLSGRHAGLPSSPDVCDIVAEADLHGFGAGVYHKATAPSLLHPFCQCRVVAVLREPSAWDDPPRDVPTPRPVPAGLADRTMQQATATADNPRTITPKHIDRQRRMAEEALQAAHDARTQERIAA